MGTLELTKQAPNYLGKLPGPMKGMAMSMLSNVDLDVLFATLLARHITMMDDDTLRWVVDGQQTIDLTGTD